MRRKRKDQELVVRQLLTRIAAQSEDPAESDLRKAARLAASEGRRPEQRPAARPWRPLRLRWAATGAAALLVATALGFGVASWLTPTSSARADAVEGFGFLPATGWTVIQAGLPGSAESTRMVAANVPITPADPQRGLPLPALHAWPPWAIVISGTLSARGDPARDVAFPIRSLPLSLADATLVESPGQPTLEYVLRAGIDGYNVDANVTFASEPTAGVFERAEEQIARLVVAPAAVTIAVRPTIQGDDPLVVYGSVSTGRADEKVTVQFKQCGLSPVQFRDHAEVLSEVGGGWSLETGVYANGVFRAVSSGDVSNEVQVQKRVDVRLAPSPPRRFVVNVVERMQFWRKQVLIQRFDRKRSRWLLVKKLRLVNTGAAPGSSFVWSTTDEFAVDVAKGTTIRAVLPLAQAKPCYIAGYSTLLVTK